MNILARLKEPSTYAGLAALVAIVAPGLADVIPQIGAQIAAVIGAVLTVVAILKADRPE